MTAGDVILVRFPFSDLPSEKKRPAILLATTKVSPKVQTITLAMVTGKVDGLILSGDVRIEEWESAHLLHPSLVRLSKIATIDVELIERRLGRLAPKDLKATKVAFQKIYSFWCDRG
ncbi:MAG: type II toxin-antitoxin system PemK/MazF family toxin [Deltaproteobacteria bacterium]|nr:type II toxin-antitoxin system PemK/MazF family toxin [Deltaproteobacteria bacterium]